jgi:hypothetical protein
MANALLSPIFEFSFSRSGRWRSFDFASAADDDSEKDLNSAAAFALWAIF